MSEQAVVKARFQITEMRGGMQFGKGHIVFVPTTPELYVNIEVSAIVEEDGTLSLDENELNQLLKKMRIIAYAELDSNEVDY